MKKSIYLFILFLISFNFLINNVTSLWLNPDVLLVLQWVWCVVGLLVYRKQSFNPLNTVRNRKFVYMFMFIMFVSTLAPYLKYYQSISDTILSQRANYSICTLLVFLYIHPSIDDIFKALKYISILTILLFISSIFYPTLFLNAVDLNERLNNGENKDIGIAGLLPGFGLLKIFFFYTGYQLINDTKKSLHNTLMFLLLMAMIFLVQNRSSYLITAPVFLYCLYKTKNKFNRNFLIFTLVAGLMVVVGYLISIFDSLMEETQNQLENSDYNRWQALYVYLFESDYTIFNFFFGHCVASANSLYLKKMIWFNEVRLAYFQDIGFFGGFYLYGVFFIIVNYYLILKGFLSKLMPHYVKFWCFGLLLVPTYQSWGLLNSDTAIEFALVFYLIMFHSYYNSKRVKNKLTQKNAAY